MGKIAELVSKKIRSLRKQNGISQADLAKKANISSRYVSQIENAAPNTTLGTVEKIAEALDAPPQAILCPEGSGTATKQSLRIIDKSILLLQSLKKTLT